ncbi:MAG: S49 family peptidase, partial [Ilumatobacteraceae bacterium]
MSARHRRIVEVDRGRGVTTEAVRANYGAGRMFLAADALKAGLIDQVGTIDDAMARVASGRVA